MSDEHLRSILRKYVVNRTHAEQNAGLLNPLIYKWANGFLVEQKISGSLAKGTAVSLSSDADIFLSLSSTTPDNLATIYNSLYETVRRSGYPARKQNVSIGVTVNNCQIDLVPAKRQSQYGNDHSLYRSKANTWTKTNVDLHIREVSVSGRLEEIKLAKIWRKRHNLSFPSLYLELAVIDCLKHKTRGDLANNFWSVLEFLRDSFVNRRYLDPANTNNVISDDLTLQEKQKVAIQAAASRSKKYWSEIVW